MVSAPTSFLPRDAGEDEELAPDLIRGGGLNGLNDLSAKGRISPKLFGRNGLTQYCRLQGCSSLKGP
jgi:hypothetical protein